MHTWYSPQQIPLTIAATALTVGRFDGVHKGHQKLLARLRRLAAQNSALPVVVLIDDAPSTRSEPNSANERIMSLEDRLALLQTHGVWGVLILGADTEQAPYLDEYFIAETLVPHLRPAAILIGAYNSHHVDHLHLAHLQSRYNIRIHLMKDAYVYQHEETEAEHTYLSDVVRSALLRGDVEEAAEILGRPHKIRVSSRSAPENNTLHQGPAKSPVYRGLLPAKGHYAGWLIDESQHVRQQVIAHVAGTDTGQAELLHLQPVSQLPHQNQLFETQGNHLTLEFAARLSPQQDTTEPPDRSVGLIQPRGPKDVRPTVRPTCDQ